MLADRLVCVWAQRIDRDAGTYRQSVLPDGCVDIVWIGKAAPVVAGPATRRIVVGLPAGANVIGARFRPGAAAGALGLPADELLNQDVPLAEMWGNDADRITEEIFQHDSESQRLCAMSSGLAARLAAAPESNPFVRAAAAWLARRPQHRVRELARSLGLSERQLHRRFCAAVGYGPKMFQRIMRFQRLLASSAAEASIHRNLADLANAVGYADHAHMCREVYAFADAAPQDVLRRRGSTLAMSDLFNTGGSPGDYSAHLDHSSSGEVLWNHE